MPTNSCGTTVSSPAGMTAPVMIRRQWPGGTGSARPAPASAVPARRSTLGPSAARSAPRSATPSIAELSCVGTSIGETTSAPSTRPSAVRIATLSTAATRGTSRAMKSCACATGSACGS